MTDPRHVALTYHTGYGMRRWYGLAIVAQTPVGPYWIAPVPGASTPTRKPDALRYAKRKAEELGLPFLPGLYCTTGTHGHPLSDHSK